MKIIITGGLGFIGSNLSNFLSKEHEIIVIDNLYTGNIKNITNENITIVKKDILDDSIESYFRDADIVFHLAGISSLSDCEENIFFCLDNNIKGTIKLLDYCVKYNIKKFIFASTGAVYENNKTFPLTENLLVSPYLNYSLSKKISEDIIISYSKKLKLNYVIFRFFNTYGPRQDSQRESPPLIPYIITKTLKNEDVNFFSDGEQRRDYVYIDDVIELLNKSIILNINEGIFNVCSTITYSVNEIFKIISENVGYKKNPKFNLSEKIWENKSITIEKEIIQNEVNKFTVGDNSETKKIFKWEPKHNIINGLTKTILHYKNDKNT